MVLDDKLMATGNRGIQPIHMQKMAGVFFTTLLADYEHVFGNYTDLTNGLKYFANVLRHWKEYTKGVT